MKATKMKVTYDNMCKYIDLEPICQIIRTGELCDAITHDKDGVMVELEHGIESYDHDELEYFNDMEFIHNDIK